MPRLHFTSRSIAAIKPPVTGQVDYWDSGLAGFGFRVSHGGTRTWIAMYRHGGRKRRMKLGAYPALSLADARTAAKGAFGSAEKGGDPAGEKTAARMAETFGEMAEQYMREYAIPNKRSWRKDRRALDRDFLPRFGHRKAADVTRREIVALLKEIRDERAAPIQANRCREIIRRIYGWAVEEEIVGINPCLGIKPLASEQSRDRVLGHDEIRAFWNALDAEPPLAAAIYKLHLLTAQRGGEVSRLRRQDLDLSTGWWTIPGELSKNGLSHRVPLSPQAMAVVETAAKLSDDDEWLFPTRYGGAPMTSLDKYTKRIRKCSKVDFVPHDLRRTASSLMTGDLGIARLAVRKILNHVESDVTAIHDRHSYDREKRQALDAWGAHLEEIVSAKPAPENVVRLQRG